MDRVVMDVMHVGPLNIGKQGDKQGVRRHCNDYIADRVATFYKGMGCPRGSCKKKDGTVRQDFWKACEFDAMCYGNGKFPGGAAAWVPSLVLLMGDCKLELRAKHGGAAPAPPAPAASSSLEELMEQKYGASLATDLLRALKWYDAYVKWRRTLDVATPTPEDFEPAAYKQVIAAVEMTQLFDQLADCNGKTKMFHIVVYILSRMSAKLGNMWRFSTAKLEARGAVCKKIVRRQTSGRKRSVDKVAHVIQKKRTTKKQRKAGQPASMTHFVQKRGYNSSRCAQLLGMMGLRERQALGGGGRRSEQLASMGKLTDQHKLRCAVPFAFRGAVPDDHPFTCVAVFESILRGEFEPLYNMAGKAQIPQVDLS